MALIICPECGNKISEYSEMCVNCGCPMSVIKRIMDRIDQKSDDCSEEKEINKTDISVVEEENYREEVTASQIEELLKKRNNFCDIEEIFLEHYWREDYESRQKVKFPCNRCYVSHQNIKAFFYYNFEKSKFFTLLAFPSGNTYSSDAYEAFKQISLSIYSLKRDLENQFEKYEKRIAEEEKREAELKERAKYIKGKVTACKNLTLEECQYIAEKLQDRQKEIDPALIMNVEELMDTERFRFKLSIYRDRFNRDYIKI